MVPFEQHSRYVGMSDRELQEAFVVRNENKALESILFRYQQFILKVIARFPDLVCEAEDIACKCFVSISEKVHSFDGQRAQLATWIHRIVKNLCIDEYRRRKMNKYKTVYQVKEINSVSELNNTCGGGTVSSLLQFEFLQDYILKWVKNNLPDQTAKILELRLINQFSFDEIGDFLKIPTGTAKSSYFKNIKHLKNDIAKLDFVHPERSGCFTCYFFKNRVLCVHYGITRKPRKNDPQGYWPCVHDTKKP
jgi:RNA polymerase sigma-70 factor (ECF subfamily)